MSKVSWALSSPIGSLEIAAKCMTQSQPSRSAGFDRADVLDQLNVGLDQRLPVAALEELEVAADDGMTFLFQDVNQVSPDEATMACNENFHAVYHDAWVGKSIVDKKMLKKYKVCHVTLSRGAVERQVEAHKTCPETGGLCI